MTLQEATAQYATLWRRVERPGVEDFLVWLAGTDFYEAPCSTKYHLAVKGGLLIHSLNVHQCLMDLCAIPVNRTALEMTLMDSLIVASLGHDICKADFYGTEMRNTKDEYGQWVKKPFYTVQDKIPLGHGEKSVVILQRFMQLMMPEIYAIRWHMSGWTAGSQEYGMQHGFSEASKLTPLVPLLAMADIMAANILEVDHD